MRLAPVLVALSIVAALVPAAPATADVKVQGSPLVAPANYPYGCETRWGPSATDTSRLEAVTVPSASCTILQLRGGETGTSHHAPGSGTVLTARVKSGANPAPLSIAIVRRYLRPDAAGTVEDTCCVGIARTPTFAPTPNAVTEVPVSLSVSTQPPVNGQAGWGDIVAVNAEGTGSLPISDAGPPHAGAASSSPLAASWYFPAIGPDDTNQTPWVSTGFEVLMSYTWCSNAVPAECAAVPVAAPAVPPTPTAAPVAAAPEKPATDAPAATIGTKSLRLKGSSVSVAVTCAQAAACKGTVRLKTRAKKPVVLAKRSVSLKAGAKGTVKLALSAKSRKKVGKKGLKVTVEVDLGTAGTIASNLTLKR